MEKEKNRDYTSVQLPADAGIKDTGKLKVYVLDNKGEVIEEASFKGNEAQLKTDRHTLREHSRVFIAPAPPAELSKEKISARYLTKSRALEIPLRIGANNIINVTRLPRDFEIFIPWNWCHITGHVNKNFIIDGHTQNLPVCHARVRIYEVDRCRLWPQIPDYVFIDVRDRLRKIVEEQLFPKPPIPPDPIGPVAFEKLNVSPRTLRKQSKAQELMQVRSLPKLSSELQAGIMSNSVSSIRESIFQNYKILHPYLCLWPTIWPWFYCLDEIRTVYTDCNGKFDTWYPVFGSDQPDIYIRVEVLINGVWTTVYSPSVPCHTRWNYACGTDINITITDPRVKPCVCNPLPGSIVWIKRVGNGTSLRRIAMNASSSSTPSPFSDVRGLTNSTGVEGNDYVSPFTLQFPFVVQFGSGFPSGSITHFRWKYRRIANADLVNVTESFQEQQGPLNKPYTYEGINSSGDLVIFTDTFPLATPLPTGNIYRIPNVEASVDTGRPTAEWDQDTDTIIVRAAGADTPNMPNGLYEFVMELCNNTGVVQVVPDNVFHVSNTGTPLSSTPAEGVDPNYLVRNGSGNVIGFRFLVRIDNDKTTCSIDDAMVQNADGTGSTTDTICGFAQYKDKNTGHMLLRFDAHQPHRYGRYSFNVHKGNSPGAVVSISGQVPEPVGLTVVNGALTAYQVRPTLASLLGSCTQAAFAEHLYVTAYHTNGSDRIQAYDSSDIAAFAIEPV
jgi:hypothetical protein